MTNRNLTCAEVDERLGDYLEGALDDASVADLELHLSGCTACTALVHDFERITRDAATLPALTPSHDLWPAIAQRLDTPVADLGAYAAARPGRQAPSRGHRLRLGAVAAGLMAITALSTYVLTSRRQAPTLAANPATDSAPRTPDQTTPSLSPAAAGVVAADPVLAATPSAASATPVSRAERLPARETYNAEISTLRGVLAERRSELDPRTVAVLESSIATIDSAIAEARRALEVDPASRFLSTQLNKALEKKLGLLRTAALLPSRT